MDYNRMSKADLAIVAAGRGIVVQPFNRRSREPTRLDYINALSGRSRADFLGMPPELRNIVYEMLLVTDPVSNECLVDLVRGRHEVQREPESSLYPAILKTCRQIHREAEDILYGVNVFQVTIGFFAVDAGGARCFPVPGRRYGHWGQMRGPWARDMDDFEWPEVLRKVQRIRVVYQRPSTPVTLFYPQTSLSFREQNAAVYSLCAWLSGNHSLRSFELDIERVEDLDRLPELDGGDRGGVDVSSLVYPLTMLGRLQKFTIKGGLRSNAAQSQVFHNTTIHRLPQSTADARIFRSAKALQQQVAKYHTVLSAAARESCIPRASRALKQLERELTWNPDGLYDYGWERTLEQAIWTLRKELRGERSELVNRLVAVAKDILAALEAALDG